MKKMIIVGMMLMGLTACKTIVENGSTSSTSSSSEGEVAPPPDFTVSPGPASSSSGDDHVVVPIPTPTPPLTGESSGEGLITINNGDNFTKDAEVDLTLYYSEPIKMKVSEGHNCEGGIWEDYATSKRFPIVGRNQSVEVSVQYTDYDDVPTQCFVDSIIQDSQGPNLLISQYPTVTLSEGDSAEIIYSASDDGIGIQDVTCKINGLAKPCLPGNNSVTTGALVRGSYTFELSATDRLGNTSSKSVTWNVSARTRAVTSNYKVNDYKKVDILFVIDNSGSMRYEQTSMAQRVSHFMSLIPGLNWQIAVTTTDPRSSEEGGDGKFLKFKGLNNQYIIDSSMDATQAQTILGNTLQRSETGSGSEQGINAVYRAVSRSLSNANPQQRAFFREGASLAVVLISDEDESANNPSNDPGKLLELIGSTFAGQKNFTFHSIITIPGDKKCLDGEGESYGYRYQQISKMTTGIIGSVCASDYAGQLQDVANKVRNMVKELTLSCSPVPGTSVSVQKSGASYSGTYHVEGLKVLFDSLLDEGDYTVSYFCAAE